MGTDSVTGNVIDYVDRMEEFRGIVFRDGPMGRRAALAGGPDVWELVATMRNCKARGEEAIAATADLLDLTDSQVRAAIRYYGAFPHEIDRRISLNAADVNEAEAAWQREQAA
ncbi:MAG TPA: hypothetical protein VFT79_02670 [Solirubrobacterales bacterium]|nr:hypothetical protein [Solirubrobacterales bacterium]